MFIIYFQSLSAHLNYQCAFCWHSKNHFYEDLPVNNIVIIHPWFKNSKKIISIKWLQTWTFICSGLLCSINLVSIFLNVVYWYMNSIFFNAHGFKLWRWYHRSCLFIVNLITSLVIKELKKGFVSNITTLFSIMEN